MTPVSDQRERTTTASLRDMHISADVPVPIAIARRLQIDPQACRLLYRPCKDNPSIAAALASLQASGTEFLIRAIGSFRAASELRGVGGISASQIVADEAGIWAISPSQLQHILENWNAEILAIVACSRDVGDALIQGVEAHRVSMWQLSSSAYEIPYLKFLERLHWVAFYSQTRRSVEMFCRLEALLPVLKSVVNRLETYIRR
jgi:hypothetical protein